MDLHRCGDCWWYREEYGPVFEGMKLANEPWGRCRLPALVALPPCVKVEKCYRYCGGECEHFKPKHFGCQDTANIP